LDPKRKEEKVMSNQSSMNFIDPSHPLPQEVNQKPRKKAPNIISQDKPTKARKKKPAKAREIEPIKVGGFDVSDFRITPGAAPVTQKHVLEIVVKKPSAQSFVWVPENPEWRCDVWVHEHQVKNALSKSVYLIHPTVLHAMQSISTKVRRKCLVTYITRDGEPRLWPLSVPEMGRENRWADSVWGIVEGYAETWIRVEADMSEGRYNVHVAIGDIPPPELPEQSLDELISLGFKGDKVIHDLNHPVIKDLLGAS
jgi:hypothetical protein